MAAPNIVNVTSITGKTNCTGITTVLSNVAINNTNSGTLVKVNDMLLSNYSSSLVVTNIIMNRSGTNYYLAGNLNVPANSTLTFLAKDTTLYLEEGDLLQANVSANSAVHVTASYEIIY
jgi:hypothetical protein